MVAKKRKAKRKKGGGRKPDSGSKSSIKAQPFADFTDKRAQLFHDQRDWRMIRLQRLLRQETKNVTDKWPDNYLSMRTAANRAALQVVPPRKRYLLDEITSLWHKIAAEFERALIHGDTDWLRRQANAIDGKRKLGDAVRGCFDAKVSTLLLQAAILNAKGNRVTASDIYDALNEKDSQTDKRPHGVLVEGLKFENRNRCEQEIRDLGTLIGLPLPDERGKHLKTKRARIAPTLNLHSAIERLRKTLR
jgi:hypothetical protein